MLVKLGGVAIVQQLDKDRRVKRGVVQNAVDFQIEGLRVADQQHGAHLAAVLVRVVLVQVKMHGVHPQRIAAEHVQGDEEPSVDGRDHAAGHAQQTVEGGKADQGQHPDPPRPGGMPGATHPGQEGHNR